MAAEHAADDFIKDVFSCPKSLYEATKFDDANLGHDPNSEDTGRMRHANATLKKLLNDDDEENGPKGVQNNFNQGDQSRGRGQIEHGAIQRDLKKLKKPVANLPQPAGVVENSIDIEILYFQESPNVVLIYRRNLLE